LTSTKSTVQVETEVVTVSLSCELGRHLACRGTVVSLTAPVGQICECPVCAHEDEPAEEEDGGLDTYVDLMIERDLEDAHFAEGWS
jgi:hypothetical protein